MIVSPGKIFLKAVSDFIRIAGHTSRATVHRFFCIATLTIASAFLASAQQGPERPQPSPNLQVGNEANATPSVFPIAKGTQPAPAAVQIANPPPTETPPPGAPATVKLQFPNSDVVDVLHMYEQLTGKKLVMDNFVQGKVNIFLTKDVSREEASKFIKLDRADATKVVDMLKDIFEKGQPTGQPGPGGIRSVRVTPPMPQPVPVEAETAALAGLTEEAVVVGKIKLTADVRTNRIHVVTRPINMPFIRRLVREFDANVEFGHPVSRSLRYISAGDVLPVLVQALTEPGAAAPAAEAGAPGAAPSPQPTPLRTTTTTAATTTGLVGAATTTTGTTGGTLNISEELATQPVDTTPKAVTVGNAKLIADQRANAIIMLGSREVVAKVEKILDEMDVKAPQVALSTVIGELTLKNDEEFGVDYFAKYNKKVVGISRNTGAPLPLPSVAPSASPVTGIGTGIVDPAGLINFSRIIQNVATGTNVYIAAGNYLATIVHLLETTGRFKVISRPMVFTSNNKKAIIASGTEIPVPVNTLTNATTVTNVASVQSSIEFKKVALQLEVVPLINSEKEVSLDILQKLDSVAGSTLVSGNLIPNIATRYIRTNVSAGNGSTIVLGGLITDNKTKNYNGIPYLSRIPVLGALFRGTTASHERTELIVLMCPQVTLTKLDLYRLRQRWENYTHYGPELDQAECPDCPKTETGKQLSLPPPDIPPAKDM